MVLSGNSWDGEDKIIARKPWSLVILTLIFFIILSMRLFKLQVLSWEDYLEKSDDKRIKREVIEAPRGYIYDRNRVVLAENRMSYSITIDPFESDRFDETIPQLASYIDTNPVELKNRVSEITAESRNPQKLIRDVDFSMLSFVVEHSSELPGVGHVFDQRRNYPQGPLASHVLGYMGELTPDEQKMLRDSGYYLGQSIGRYGIEEYCEPKLKGKNGAKFEERNYMNRILQVSDEYAPDPSVPGNDVTLTLDARLQMVAEEAFGDTVLGALVALDPRNGEVLVMTSKPSFDPNEFASVMTTSRSQALWNDPDKPMFNRAIQATYPPGSTFKMIAALAGLESGCTERTTFSPCRGVYYFGRPYKCWQEGGHGTLDMVGAIINSCNIYFYQLGRRVGIEKWHEMGELFGIGQKTGLDLDGEGNGILPGIEYYQHVGVDYSPGMILNLAIGQGETALTVLQMARYVGIIATKGLITTPHLDITRYGESEQIVNVSPHSFDVVREAMWGVVNSSAGTAQSVRIPGHVIAGKTGTSQNPQGADHKIFIAFAPFDNPSIAIACVAENTGDYPGSIAIQIVKRVLAEYFNSYPDITVASNE